MTSHAGTLRRASLEVLRAEAQDELGTVVWERLHGGEDPWAFMDVLPTIDELVVLLLRSELIGAEAKRRHTLTDDDRMLRQIAEVYPGLAATVSSMLERLNALRWSA